MIRDIHTVVLDEELVLAIRREFKDHEGRHVTLRQFRNEMLGGMVFDLSRSIYGRIAASEIDEAVHVPADWWQHFKQRWFTRRMLRWWPLKRRRIGVKVTKHSHVCPHLDLPPGKSAHVIHLMPELGEVECQTCGTKWPIESAMPDCSECRP